VCANVGGTWDAVEDVQVTCTLAGQPPETDTIHGAGRITITQNGCALSYVFPNSSITRTGVIDGQPMRFSGPFALALSGDVQFSRNSISIAGNLQGNRMVLQGSGTAEGTAQGSRFVCTGNSTATFTRVGTPGVAARGQEEHQEEPVSDFSRWCCEPPHHHYPVASKGGDAWQGQEVSSPRYIQPLSSHRTSASPSPVKIQDSATSVFSSLLPLPLIEAVVDALRACKYGGRH
jgi:hypothetical protein